jgi:small GTP-binding protein
MQMSGDRGVHQFKVVVVGSSGVGKTSIVEFLQTGSFRAESQPTIGVQFKTYSLETDGEAIKLQIWDTAGQERFRAIARAYFRNAVGGILVFDLTNRQSFDDLNLWINDLNTLCAANAQVILVGNKADLTDERQIVEGEAQAFAQRYNLTYLETSARTGANVAETVVRLATEILRKVKDGQIVLTKPSEPTTLTTGQQTEVEQPCC